ncbi:hypothetical protein [Bacillus sp. CGMCC 1.16541]|nr:hypothetical protein [Bacillus sp. CGMCC 1.16541]
MEKQEKHEQEKHLICSEQLFWSDLRAIVDDMVHQEKDSRHKLNSQDD